MEGAVRVFAGEFCRATLSVPGDDDRSTSFVVTPGGAWCRILFIAGALVEVEERGDMIGARVADPTGGFDLVIGGRNTELSGRLKKLPLPSFVSVLGRAQMHLRNGSSVLTIRPDEITAIDRTQRDLWVLATASATLERLEELRSGLLGRSPAGRVSTVIRHYRTSSQELDELALMIGSAVQNVQPGPVADEKGPDVKGLVLELIGASKEPRGIAVEEILDTLGVRGIGQQSVLAAIESLILEDECYQPQKGFVRLL